MTSDPTTKVRLVKCPKCLEVLREPAEFPLYQCGGCYTVLQAKHRQNDKKRLISGLQEIDPVQTNEVEQISECKEFRSSSGKASFPSSERCCMDRRNERGQNESGDCNREQSVHAVSSDEASYPTELSLQEKEELSTVAVVSTLANENDKASCNLTRTNPLAGSEKILIVSAQQPIGENLLLDTLVSPTRNAQPEKSGILGFDHVTSANGLETVEAVDASSEPSGTLGDMSKSPTTGSCHAYDGSVSSYDGIDDQVPDYSKSFGITGFANTKEKPKRDKLPANNTSELKDRARNSSSISSYKKHQTMKCSSWDGKEETQLTRYGQSVRNVMGMERDELPLRVPFYARSSQSSYELGSPSTQGLDVTQYSPHFHSPDKHGFAEEDKMKLLRMVYELQEQLNRMYTIKGKASERAPAGMSQKDKQIPVYRNYNEPEPEPYEEICHNSNHVGHPRRWRQVKNWHQQQKYSRMAFSEEATNSRMLVDSSCPHCCPQKRQCSVPLVCCNEGLFCGGHNSHSSCSPSSPHSYSYLDSEFPLGRRGTKSGDLRHRDFEAKKSLRERCPLGSGPGKRHFRAIAGGAPFVTCYCCLKLLQLPADFIFFERRCHRLRCSYCWEVLEFWLHNKNKAPDHPPNAVDDNSSAVNGRILTVSGAAEFPHQVGDPMSYSDDCGRSLSKSCSTEGEITAPFTPPVAILLGNKLPSVEKKENLVPEESPRPFHKHRMETVEWAGGSSNSKPDEFSAEVERLPPTGGSPLHRLMGYSSPNEMIYGSEMNV